MKRSNGLSKARLRRLRDVIDRHVEQDHMPGAVMAVSRRGDVHVEAVGTMTVGGGEPMRRDTIFRITSMTKPVTAVAAMILIEECELRLDEPVDRLLPELANPRVLRSLDSPLDESVAANRPITLRDLLTFRLGWGSIMAPPGSYPIQRAIDELGILGFGAPDPSNPHDPDEWLRLLGTLPLIHQPGEQWMYNTGSYVLGVLIARAAGQPLETFLRERIFEPLGMKDTGFHVPADRLDRLASAYQHNPETGQLELFDGVADSRWSRPPAFPDGSAGLVSTVDDYLAFARMLLGKGRYGDERILSRPSIEVMTTDQLTPEQKASSPSVPIFLEGRGWGFGVAVDLQRTNPWSVPGRFGWDGGFGTYSAIDPREKLVGILLTQRLFGPEDPGIAADFWMSAYQALDD